MLIHPTVDRLRALGLPGMRTEAVYVSWLVGMLKLPRPAASILRQP
ncbi:hypothetical protein V1289_008592 [Bradyrhizobium sp. AZCC 2289]